MDLTNMDNTTTFVATMMAVGLILSFGMWHGLQHLFKRGATWKERFHGFLIAILGLMLLISAGMSVVSKGLCHV